MGKKDIEISIIVPVYNVYNWLDECLQSIADQTFQDFEVLLINDGSTDGSEKKCREWSEKDGRIRVINGPNRGLSVSRNIGLTEAQGTYIIFIDSDDWIDLRYVEKLYTTICETGADLVECDYWRYNDNTGEKVYRPCYGCMGIEYTVEEKMIYGESVAWRYISKKELWSKNKIEMPDCLGASHAVYVLLLGLGAKVISIHEPLYYYRRMRKGSIIDINGKGSKEEGKMGIAELSAMISEFKNRGLYEQYRELLERVVKYRMSDLLAAQFSRKSVSDFLVQYGNYREYIDQIFPDRNNHIYFNVGGYNLNKIVSYLPELHNPYYRFNFSSLISIVNPVKNWEYYAHSNKYRSKMIDRDATSVFWSMLEEIKPDFLFMDFIEERFDVIRLGDGYVTKSDAYDELQDKPKGGLLIKNQSMEFKRLWEESCICFFERVCKVIPLERIYIIENYLSEKVGDVNKQNYFQEIDEIKNINVCLKSKYEFIKKYVEEIQFVEAYKGKLYFTDQEYVYGAMPSHLNEIVNRKIARQIEKMLE